MRINNPKTTAGGLPLATTWYVNARHLEQKKYTDQASSYLFEYTEDQIADARAFAKAGDEALSTQVVINDRQLLSAVCNFFTGNGEKSEYINQFLETLPEDVTSSIHYIPRTNGYAYLAENKKIHPDLMPAISIMDIKAVSIKEIFDYLNSNAVLALDHDKELYKMLLNADGVVSNDIDTITNVFRRALEIFALGQQAAGKFGAIAPGDVIVITNKDIEVVEALVKQQNSGLNAFKDVFARNFACGAWICSESTYGETDENKVGLNKSITYIKMSYNQGQIIGVNSLPPAADGNVSIDLGNIFITNDDGTMINKIGTTLAKNIQMVKNTLTDVDVMEKVSNTFTAETLVDLFDISNRFVFDNGINCCHAYTTVDEFMTLNIKTREVTDIISAALDAEVKRATDTEDAISAALSAEIDRSTAYDNYLSGVVGTQSALSGVSVTDALVALKAHTEKVDENAISLLTAINDYSREDYQGSDILRVKTIEIAADTVANLEVRDDIAIRAKRFDVSTIADFDTIYEGNVYNYFGFEPAASGYTVSQVTIDKIPGKIVDIYVESDVISGHFEKVDADIEYYTVTENDKSVTYSKITLLGEYDASKDNLDTNVTYAETTALSHMVIRTATKFIHEFEATNKLFS